LVRDNPKEPEIDLSILGMPDLAAIKGTLGKETSPIWKNNA